MVHEVSSFTAEKTDGECKQLPSLHHHVLVGTLLLQVSTSPSEAKKITTIVFSLAT